MRNPPGQRSQSEGGAIENPLLYEMYFVTLFTLEQKVFLGHVVDSLMDANICGATVRDVWLEIEKHHPQATLDVYAVLPHYVQGLIALKGRQSGSIEDIIDDYKVRSQERITQLFRPTSLTLWEERHTIERVESVAHLDSLRVHLEESPSRWTSQKNQPAGEWLTGFIDRLASGPPLKPPRP